jgi:hypothetical protein
MTPPDKLSEGCGIRGSGVERAGRTTGLREEAAPLGRAWTKRTPPVIHAVRPFHVEQQDIDSWPIDARHYDSPRSRHYSRTQRGCHVQASGSTAPTDTGDCRKCLQGLTRHTDHMANHRGGLCHRGSRGHFASHRLILVSCCRCRHESEVLLRRRLESAVLW